MHIVRNFAGGDCDRIVIGEHCQNDRKFVRFCPFRKVCSEFPEILRALLRVFAQILPALFAVTRIQGIHQGNAEISVLKTMWSPYFSRNSARGGRKTRRQSLNILVDFFRNTACIAQLRRTGHVTLLVALAVGAQSEVLRILFAETGAEVQKFQPVHCRRFSRLHPPAPRGKISLPGGVIAEYVFDVCGGNVFPDALVNTE